VRFWPRGVRSAKKGAPELPVWPDHLQPGRVTDVAPGVRRIIAPNPGLMTGPGTNTYLLGDDRLALVDPGPDDDAHLTALLEATGDRLGWILVTHTHLDHSPLSARLHQATGAEVLAFGPAPSLPAALRRNRRRPWRRPRRRGLDAHDTAFVPGRVLLDGDRLDTGELAIDAVYTPGHTSNHLCFELAGSGLLFSGDHVMSGSTVVIAPPDGDMAAYLESLERVRARAPRRIAPGHGDVIDDPAAVLDQYLRHRMEREAQVLAGLQKAPRKGVTAEQLVAAIYTEVPAALHPVARYSVWAHLRKLEAEQRAWTADVDDIDAPWGLRRQPTTPASSRP
jgi:glyoxylase-like metal-dependent hydrolase (beta-lactamase superfamily II)